MPKPILTFCGVCQLETNQKVLFSKKVEEEWGQDKRKKDQTKFEGNYMVLKCAGCDSLSFFRRTAITDLTGSGEPSFSFDENFPEEENQSDFLKDEQFAMLPSKLRKLYAEVKLAFSNQQEILAGVGLRMLLEAVCNDQKITGANLQQKVVGLKNKGLVSPNEEPILDKLRLIGNVAAHEIKGLRFNILSYALDIINHLLISIYILPRINKRIKF